MEAISNLFSLFHEMAVLSIIALVITAIAVTAVLFKLFQHDLSNTNM